VKVEAVVSSALQKCLTPRAYYIASALAFVPVSLLAMQSLQQIRVFDVVLVGVLTLLIIFYIIKRTYAVQRQLSIGVSVVGVL
jgi:hypothetical protein